ncbi:exodeoxyribonuclease V subunit beta [Shewanella sp. 202IG2-18]|uniref:exodeoxyribonuclease V subunit beta n=1 Tax=Parashewanella hymeniacidonis TaxID=2807618 RepID=UPI00196043E7|nr:exodeoxyribonuclease V subunit beta [Parashewanella hymeniacidonis]MBM7072884.1 exodeoxyribonuclease V subunit beta [Parashewanella hymeniacidonis]
MSQSQLLNPLTLPLSNRGLIEASAGTGKTYTISGLYLRLLVGHGCKPLTCEQILVVTFTNAATEELRDRIRNRIRTAYQAFLGLECDDDFIKQLFNEIDKAEHMMALRRLDLALKSLDESSIFTIHGFCQRILSDMAFESATLFETEFTLDDSEYLHHAVRDFWRQHCYTLDSAMAQVIQQEFGEPENLLKQIRPLLNATEVKVLTKTDNFEDIAQRLIQSLSDFKSNWKTQHNGTLKQLEALPLNGVRFGKKTENFPKLHAMFDTIGNWVKNGRGLPPKKAMEALAYSNIKLNKGGEMPHEKQVKLLKSIEKINNKMAQLKPAFLQQAVAEIKLRFDAQKTQHNILTPDDLLSKLAAALKDNNETLPTSILNRFPVALIDEFQDTDPLQFEIFSTIYQATDASGLLMIGDPKQAIYAFRGADIHTYLQAREQTKDHYYLGRNWRSSESMVNGVNGLFLAKDDPFISDSIPFENVDTPSSAKQKIIQDSINDDSALRLRLLSEEPEKGLNKASARKILAEDAAAEIVRLLNEGQNGTATISGEPIQAKDIAVLVRDRNEATIIKQSLADRNIGAVFLSRDSVYHSNEAVELAIVLRSLVEPKNERLLRSALATKLLGYTAEQIHQFNYDENQRQLILDLFDALSAQWQQRGVMPALLNMAAKTQLISRLLHDDDGERRLTDFRHLAELLQQKSTELDGISALLSWFEQQLIASASGEDQQLRLESEQNLVQIVTIHKSKGLEYPICFIPFVSLARDNRRRPSPMLYHHNNALVWDVEQTDEGWDKQKKEVLAEDLRLLYVALTRPVYRCYLGVANHSRFTKRSGLASQLHETAIGYLLGIDSKECDFSRIQEATANLACASISSAEIQATAIDKKPLNENRKESSELAAKPLCRIIDTPWRVGSYSGLVKNLAHANHHPGADDEGADVTEAFADVIHHEEVDPYQRQDRFNFEKGANAGSFLHLVLELIDFTNPLTDLEKHLPEAMSQYGIDDEWYQILLEWYLDLLAAPMSKEGLSLGIIKPEKRLVEMEFYLPIEKLTAEDLNQTLEDFGYGINLDFDSLQGMLKGFIDLTFEHDGKFYIADYKSNYLGEDFECYEFKHLILAMMDHRYDLQYILYSLALHRFLKNRLPNYNYDTHFGGCYYLFLRGMSVNHTTKGIYFDKPPKALIERLDKLFSGDVINDDQEQAS